MNFKHHLRFIIGIVIFTLSLHSIGHAGTVFVGAKGWYAIWDSYFGNVIKQIFSSELYLYDGTNYYYPHITSDIENGKGYMAGALLGYQTDDKLWSISFAYMGLSNFKQDMSFTIIFNGLPNPYPDPFIFQYDVETEIKKAELDVAVGYSISNYLKVFIGYKYLHYEQKFILSYLSLYSNIKAQMSGHLPTTGIGFVYPLSSKLTLTLQGGILYGFYNDMKTSTEGGGSVMKLKNKPGFNVEGGFNFILTNSLIIQTALRYQYLKLETDPQEGEQTLKGNDIFYGGTVGLVYVFSI